MPRILYSQIDTGIAHIVVVNFHGIVTEEVVHDEIPGGSVIIIIIIMIRTGDLYTESGQTLQGSLLAVSKPNFASKYSLESSRRDLHNALLCTVLQSQNFSQKSSSFFRDWVIEFPIFSISSSNFAFFLRNFDEKKIPDFAPNSREEWGLSLFN